MWQKVFFRQSAWMIFSTCAGGLLLYGVHLPVVTRLPPGEYSVFATLLQVIHLMMIPSLALQSIFAEAGASAGSEEEKRELAGSVQGVLFWTFVVWLCGLLVLFLFHGTILATLKIPSGAPLYFTGLCGVSLLWLPMLQGLMQGEENFLWLGWGAIINGAGRFAFLGLVLYLMGGEITTVMAGVFAGMMLNLAVGIIQTCHIWFRPLERFTARRWLERAIPITLALGAAQTMFCADMVEVQSIFDDLPKIDLYGFAGTIARGLVILTAPIIGVMFPKAVHRRADFQSSGLLRQALGYTALLAGGGALFCTFFPQVPVAILRKSSYLPIVPLIPWFCWAMVPLVFATVLVSHLMAVRDFRCVASLIIVVFCYLITMKALGPFYRIHPDIEAFYYVVLTLAIFNSAFLAVSIYFNLPWLTRASPKER